jgi:hypothetical protein
MATLVELA